MSAFKKYAKDILKRSRLYQARRGKDYFKNRESMFKKLKNDEISAYERTLFLGKSKSGQLVRMMKKTQILITPGRRFQSWIDTGLYVLPMYSVVDNMAPNYELILNNSLDELISVYSGDKSKLFRDINNLLRGVKQYIFCIEGEIDKKIFDCNDEDTKIKLEKTRQYFDNMITKSAVELEEGFQRIIFWSTLFWQSQHRLMGLGRLDKILCNLNRPSDSETLELMKDFFAEIHRYYAFKSNGRMLGDTGQIIELGGSNENGDYFCNDLTYLFINALKDCMLPDPKILLRVSEKMPEDLLKLALQCISTGIGSPLLSNDDAVICALERFGYSHRDACDYVTSACWEPLAYGRSLEQNNLGIINYAKAFVDTYEDVAFENCMDFDSVMDMYLDKLSIQLRSKLSILELIKWESDPLMSLFIKDCTNRKLDVSQGGALYNNYGILSSGMPNAVNSLLNVKHLVFEEHSSTLKEVKNACMSDFDAKYDAVQKMMRAHEYFGKDDRESVEITKKIADYTYKVCEGWRNPMGGKLKWGLSAPSYVEAGGTTGATADGRKRGMPITAHISSNDAYTELTNFASKIDYSGQRSNGNVIDFIVAPDFIHKNMKKFMTFLKTGIHEGFFQMQMNVVSSKTLIEAKDNPELFPDLIVRVWGFSAYFNDLPNEYKDTLIQRAVESERSY